MDILKKLNPQQKEAVTAPPGQVLVLAGPGSGKTRVLTQRAAYLIHAMGVLPTHILAVTFTNKAAREMESRLKKLLGSDLEGIWLGTFHATCAHILRREAQHLPFDSNFVIMDADDQQAIVKRCLKELNLDDKLYPPPVIHSIISRSKNNLIKVQDFIARSYYGEVALRVFERYEYKLRASNALDFDDLLLWTVQLLSENDEVRQRYARRFEHVLVDEFQDTNLVQYELLKLLSCHHHNLFVVGDEDQSIYRWRGADSRNILRFEKEYPKALKLLLERNYRSSQNVLDTAKAVINHNPSRTIKNLFSKRRHGEAIVLYESVDDHAEAAFVVDSILNLLNNGDASGGDIAVMYRTNAQSRLLEEAFLRANLPYRLVGAQRFYGRREVKDLIAFLRLAQNSYDEISLLRVINVPPRGIGSKTLVALHLSARRHKILPIQTLLDLGTNRDESPYWKDFNSRGAAILADFCALLTNWQKLSQSATLPELFNRILKDTAYREYIKDDSEIGLNRWENVLELRRLAYEFEYLGLSAFLENVALISDQDTLPEKLDSPTLLTLHAAKGLEFKVVFITGLDDGLLPHRRSMEDPEEMAEERRLFYVGITRTKDRLFLVRADQRSNFGSYAFSIPSRFLADIPEKLLVRQGAHIYRQRTSSGYGIPLRWQPTHISASAQKTTEVTPEFKAGMRVRHTTLGEGLVIESRILDNDEIVTVAFEEKGIKRLAASIAKLEIIS
ncbi:MAG TPA: UvrD-helicase domain-containing protein [Anaerolineae bacterium]|nr:UvrD-helicase domain-containing protein [Anaerolineae bacterium]